MAKLLITVTERHIRKGDPGDSSGCPIALALKDNGYPNPWVSTHDIHLYRCGKPYKMPTVAVRWEEEYDETGLGKPFSFELQL